MNSKANRKTIPFPFTLNLADTKAEIDTTFQGAEKQNSPYLNGSHSPLYIKEIDGAATYDKFGNRYTIEGGILYKDDGLIKEELFTVERRHFTKDLINDPSTIAERVLAYGPNGYNVRFDDKTNSVKLYKNNVTKRTVSHIYDVGAIVTARCYYQDSTAIAFVVYKTNNQYKLLAVTETHDATTNINWKQQKISGTTSVFVDKTITEAMPLIQAFHTTQSGGAWIVTVYSQYGQASIPVNQAYCTKMFVSNAFKEITVTRPTNTTTIVTNYKNEIQVNITRSQGQQTKALLAHKNDNGTYTYYDYSTQGVVGAQLNVPTTFRPSISSQIITINNVNYNYGTYTYYTITLTASLRANQSGQGDAVFTLTKDDGTTGTATVTSSASSRYATYAYSKSDFEVPSISFTAITVTWRSATDNIPQGYWNNAVFIISRTETQSGVTIAATIVPNVACDNGKLYALFTFTPTISTSEWGQYDLLSNGYTVVESGTVSSFSVSGSTATITIQAVESFTNNKELAMALRSNCFCVNPYFYYDWTRYTIGSKYPATLYNDGSDELTAAIYEVLNTSNSPKTLNSGSVYYTDYNFYGAADSNHLITEGAPIDYFGFVPGGFRADITNNWHILYTMLSDGQCIVQGISYSESSDEMGTLVTPWESVDPKFAPFVDTDGSLVYKENETDKLYRISIATDAIVSSVLDNRYIIVNTPSYWNAYDPIANKKFHFATDYNGRLLFGSTEFTVISPLNATKTGATLTANAINYNFRIRPRNAFVSIQYPIVNRQFIDLDSNPTLVGCNSPEDPDLQLIDVYYSEYSATSCKYRYSVIAYDNGNILKTTRFNIYGTTYQNDESITMNPCILAEFIDGSGANDLVKEGSVGYPLQYAEDEPIFGYKYTTTTVLDDVGNFFTLQGQHYLIANDKLYTASYSDGVLISKDAIIDVRNFKFVGNNSMISFWWDPRNKALFSFTGDGVMKHLFDASKLNTVTGKFFYEESTNAIYIPTSNGLLVIGPNNTYLLEEFKNVSHVYFCKDNITYIINGNKTIAMKYYAEEDFEPLPLDIETSFYGLGDKENQSIDRFDIVLYDIDGQDKTCEITYGIRSITDVTVKSEENTKKITPDMYDKWSHSILISYSPKYIKGQGLRLYIKSPIAIESITAHLTDNGTATPTAISRHI